MPRHSQIRARVEHIFRIIKVVQFGYRKVRHKGLHNTGIQFDDIGKLAQSTKSFIGKLRQLCLSIVKSDKNSQASQQNREKRRAFLTV